MLQLVTNIPKSKAYSLPSQSHSQSIIFNEHNSTYGFLPNWNGKCVDFFDVSNCSSDNNIWDKWASGSSSETELATQTLCSVPDYPILLQFDANNYLWVLSVSGKIWAYSPFTDKSCSKLDVGCKLKHRIRTHPRHFGTWFAINTTNNMLYVVLANMQINYLDLATITFNSYDDCNNNEDFSTDQSKLKLMTSLQQDYVTYTLNKALNCIIASNRNECCFAFLHSGATAHSNQLAPYILAIYNSIISRVIVVTKHEVISYNKQYFNELVSTLQQNCSNANTQNIAINNSNNTINKIVHYMGFNARGCYLNSDSGTLWLLLSTTLMQVKLCNLISWNSNINSKLPHKLKSTILLLFLCNQIIKKKSYLANMPFEMLSKIFTVFLVISNND